MSVNIKPQKMQITYTEPFCPKVGRVEVKAEGHVIMVAVYDDEGHPISSQGMHVQQALALVPDLVAPPHAAWDD
jgi:hypothetical protein